METLLPLFNTHSSQLSGSSIAKATEMLGRFHNIRLRFEKRNPLLPQPIHSTFHSHSANQSITASRARSLFLPQRALKSHFLTLAAAGWTRTRLLRVHRIGNE